MLMVLMMLMVLLRLLMVVDDSDDADGVDDVDDLDNADDADGADADLGRRCWGSAPCLALCGGGVKTRVSSKASLHQPFDSSTNAHR